MAESDASRRPSDINVEAPTVVSASPLVGLDENGLEKPSSDRSGSAKTEIHGGPEEAVSGDKTVISKRPVMDAPPAGSPAETAQVLVGRRLDHFVLEELIGGGGMGAVFRARDTRLDRIVAVKVLPRVSQDPDLLRRFRVEAQSAARLDHPNIARIYDVGQQDGWHYIVFEHIEGINVRDYVARQGVLSVDQAVMFTYQTAEALQHAWRRGVVHRDVKPSNLLVDATGHIKLVDMGLARSQAMELSDDLTASNVTLGTFDYISPEQARDPRVADVRSDLYSLGCTLYYMLVGQPPYPGGTVVQKLLSHGSTPPPDPRLVREDVSDDLTAILFKMLSKQPEQRYQEPTDLMADLAELARRERLPFTAAVELPVAATTSAVWTQLWQQHLPWMVAVAMLVTSIVGLRLATPISSEIEVPPLVNAPPSLVQRSVPTDPSKDLSITRELTAPSAVPPTTVPSSAVSGGAVPSSTVPPATVPAPLANAPEPSAAMTTATIPLPIGTNASLAPPPTLVLPVPVTKIVVAPLGATSIIGGQEVVGTLEEAMKRCAAQPQVNTIEIDDDRIRSTRLRVPRSGITIRSAGSRKAVIAFDDPLSLQYAMQRPAMVETVGHSIRFEDVHLVWSIPSAAREGGSFFLLSGGEDVALVRSSLTLEGNQRRDDAYAIEIVHDVTAGRATAPTPLVGLAATSIQLDTVLIRGEFGLVRMDAAVPLTLKCTNGLLAISGRCLDSGGAERPEPQVPIRLDFSRTTAYSDGLAQVRLGPSGKYPPMLQRISEHSIFFGRSTSLAHIEYLGLSQIPQAAFPWMITGESNVYESGNEYLFCVRANGSELQQYRATDLNNVPWYQERSAQFGLATDGVWPPDEPLRTLDSSDFQQSNEQVGFLRQTPPSAPASVKPEAI